MCTRASWRYVAASADMDARASVVVVTFAVVVVTAVVGVMRGGIVSEGSDSLPEHAVNTMRPANTIVNPMGGRTLGRE